MTLLFCCCRLLEKYPYYHYKMQIVQQGVNTNAVPSLEAKMIKVAVVVVVVVNLGSFFEVHILAAA